MTQKEIIEWAISGIKIKRIAMLEGYKRLNKTHPKVGSEIFKIVLELNEKQDELEKLLKKEEK